MLNQSYVEISQRFHLVSSLNFSRNIKKLLWTCGMYCRKDALLGMYHTMTKCPLRECILRARAPGPEGAVKTSPELKWLQEEFRFRKCPKWRQEFSVQLVITKCYTNEISTKAMEQFFIHQKKKKYLACDLYFCVCVCITPRITP